MNVRKSLLVVVIAVIGMSKAPLRAMDPPAYTRAFQEAPRNIFFGSINAIKNNNEQRVLDNIRNYPGIVRAVDDGGSTLLIYAAGFGRTVVVKALLKAGADKNARNRAGQTALDRARQWNRTDIISLLEKRPIKLAVPKRLPVKRATIKVGELPEGDKRRNYFFASIKAIKQSNNALVMRNLEQHEDFPFFEDDFGNTLLAHAAQQGNFAMVQELILRGAEVNKTDNKTNTPLAKALTARPQTRGHKDVIALLLRNGAMVYAKATVMLFPTTEFRQDIDTSFGEERDYDRLPPEVQAKVTPIAADKLHMTLAYVAIPITYDQDEGYGYRHPDIRPLENVLRAQQLNQTLFDEFQREPFEFNELKIMGSFVTLTFTEPAWLTTTTDEFYRRVFESLPTAVKTYKEKTPPHISVAKLKPGQRFVKDQVLPQTIRYLSTEDFFGTVPQDTFVNLVIRVPSQHAPEGFYEDQRWERFL